MVEKTGIERRVYRRFADRSFGNVEVCLRPLAPLKGPPTLGRLIDLSAGGMAILLPRELPKQAILKMTMCFPNDLWLESEVRICHVAAAKADKGYLHGVEFFDPSAEIAETINRMAEDSVSCGERVRGREPNVCVKSCSLYAFCEKPERHPAETKPAPPPLELADETASWAAFRDEARKRMGLDKAA